MPAELSIPSTGRFDRESGVRREDVEEEPGDHKRMFLQKEKMECSRKEEFSVLLTVAEAPNVSTEKCTG